MNRKTIWSDIEGCYDILGGYGYPAMDKAADELGLEPDYLIWIAALWLFYGEMFTAHDYMRMFPYGQILINDACFATAVIKGYLVSDGTGRYTHSEEGLEIAKKLWRAAGDSLLGLDPISVEHTKQLFGYFDRLIESMLAAPEPSSHFYLSHKHNNYRRYGTECRLEDFVVRFGELSAFRDDCYIATWKAQGVEGHTWETFDQLVQYGALTFDNLFEKVERRVPTRELLAKNVMGLARRGWVEEVSGVVHVTSAGKHIRAEVEGEMERLFYAPWSVLIEADLDELASIASQFRKGLQTSIEIRNE